MAYLGYKNKAFREYKREQERVKMWKAAEARKRKKRREIRNVTNTTIIQLIVVALIIAFYGVFASALIADEKGSKVGVGTSGNLTGYVNTTDFEGDNITLVYNWYKNGVLNATTLVQDELIGFYEQEFHRRKNEIELIQMGVLKEHQGKRLGSFLLEHIIHKAFSKNVERVWVHTCSLDHKHALDNYLSKGFKTFKEETINFVL